MAFTDPSKNVEQFGLAKNSTVVVFGSGAGGHSFASARALKGSGRVYAVDVRRDMLSKLKNDAIRLHLTNVTPVHGNIEIQKGTGLKDGEADAVIIPNTLFAYDDKPGILREAFRITKDGGRLLIVDWRGSFGNMGPTPEHVVTQQSATELAVKAGFAFVQNISAGTYHYGAIYQKKVS